MWPDSELERQMLKDVELCEKVYCDPIALDPTRHVRALLQRVRDLEAVNGQCLQALKLAKEEMQFDAEHCLTRNGEKRIVTDALNCVRATIEAASAQRKE